MNTENKYTMKMSEFREQLRAIPDDWDVCFAVDGIRIIFYRAKKRGDTFIQMEFNESDEYPLHSSLPDSSRGQ
jgi:hypothetical protein